MSRLASELVDVHDPPPSDVLHPVSGCPRSTRTSRWLPPLDSPVLRASLEIPCNPRWPNERCPHRS